MTLYFPPGPADGDEHIIGDITYVWDDTNGVWNAKTTSQGESYTKLEADNKFVEVAGDAMTGTLSLGNNRITNLRDPIGPYDAVNFGTAEAEANKKVDRTGDSMVGNLTMTNHFIHLVKDPVALHDASTKNYTDLADTALENKKVDRSGDTMSGNLTLADGLGSPLVITNPAHAATKQYVDNEILNNISSPISYKGLIDASLSGPTSTPVKTGDFYVHENSDGSGDSVTPDAAWGLTEDIDDLDRLLYDGTQWAILHTAGEYVAKVGGDYMEGPLRINPQAGDNTDNERRAHNKVITSGIYSASSSNLQLGISAGAGVSGIGLTKMYVGDSNIDTLVPIRTTTLEPRANQTGIKYTGATTDPKHIVTKEVLDKQFINRIGEYRFNLTGSSFDPGDFMASTTVGGIPSSSPVDPIDVAEFTLSNKDINGKDVGLPDFGVYIQVTGVGGHQAFYAIVGGNGAIGTDFSIQVIHQFGDGFTFNQDDVYVIEPANELLMKELFVNKLTPEMFGDVTIKNSKIIQDYSDTTSSLNEIYKFLPKNDGSDTTNNIVFANAGGTQVTSIDLQGNTATNRLQIRAKSNGRDPIAEFRSDGNIEFYNDIKLKTGTFTGATQPRITGLGDPVDDSDAVSLGYITEKLQDKFEELIGQSAQGTFFSGSSVVPTQGQYSCFNNSANQINNLSYFFPSDVADFSFHTIDKDGRNIDFLSLKIGDYIVSTFDGSTSLVRYRVESVPAPHGGGSAVVDVDVSWVSGGLSEIPGNAIMSIQFQRTGGSVDLTDYVKKAGDTMTGTLTMQDSIIRATGTGAVQTNTIQSNGNSNVSFRRSGDTKFLMGTSSVTFYVNAKLNNNADLVMGNTNSNIILQNGTQWFSNNDLLMTTGGNGLKYEGHYTVDTHLATKKNVDDVENQLASYLKLDVSNGPLTNNLTVKTNDESKLILSGNKNNATDGFATLEFENTSGISDKEYLVLRGNTKATRYFKFTAPVTVSRNNGGDNQDNTIVEGRVGSGSSTNDRLLSVFTNTAGNGGDAVNYYGKTDGNNNIQNKKSVEDMLTTAFPFKITTSGGQYFIEPS